MLLIYSSKKSSRLDFILEFIFGDILGVEYRLTCSFEEFNQYNGPRINYSDQKSGEEILIYPCKLLFEKGISNQEINVFEWNDSKVFFGTHPKYSLPFDPFGAAFYLVTRYEEYLPHFRDEYNRFNSNHCTAFQKGFLNKPVIDIWAYSIKTILLEKYPGMHFKDRKYQFIPTVDIDNAFAFREKGLMRTIGGTFKSLFHMRFHELFERAQVLLGIVKDPYDTYDYMLSLHKQYNVKPFYFFLVGEYGENDKNLSIGNRAYQNLIKRLADYSPVGIHPSFGSNESIEKLKKEISDLSKTLKREISQSRQHFLKLHFPETYRNLIEIDISDDYTMGYAAHLGFRAGTCTPFYFYDLDMEISHKLKIHPFQVMDATLLYYLKLKPSEVMSLVYPIIQEIKAVNGTFATLWHNESLSNYQQWKGWKDVYELIMKEAVVN
jgi:hypothetical protein